jgi:hypothetical protein
LKYSHVCGRSFDPVERAIEQKRVAEAAAIARMRQYSATEHTVTQNERVQEHATERVVEHKGRNYSQLLKF